MRSIYRLIFLISVLSVLSSAAYADALTDCNQQCGLAAVRCKNTPGQAYDACVATQTQCFQSCASAQNSAQVCCLVLMGQGSGDVCTALGAKFEMRSRPACLD